MFSYFKLKCQFAYKPLKEEKCANCKHCTLCGGEEKKREEKKSDNDAYAGVYGGLTPINK
jgi:hypothetical protein